MKMCTILAHISFILILFMIICMFFSLLLLRFIELIQFFHLQNRNRCIIFTIFFRVHYLYKLLVVFLNCVLYKCALWIFNLYSFGNCGFLFLLYSASSFVISLINDSSFCYLIWTFYHKLFSITIKPKQNKNSFVSFNQCYSLHLNHSPLFCFPFWIIIWCWVW